MKHVPGLLAVGLCLLLAGGCRSTSRQEAVLSDLMRDIETQGEGAPAETADAPDAPMAQLPTSDMLPPARTATGVGGDGKSGPLEDYTPIDVTAAGSPLTIQADSVLRITVAEDPGLSGSYPVNSLGGIQLGYIGPVILDNLTELQAVEKICNILLSREFQSANVTVKILRPSYGRVRIAGAVRRPGYIQVGAGDEVSLNNALNQSGGIVDTPWNTRVKVVRGGMNSILAAYLPGEVYSLTGSDKKPKVPEVMLRNNDVVFVYSPQARGTAHRGEATSKWVLVLGEVGRPGIYQFREGDEFSMMHLVFRMGGFPSYANAKAVRVIRTDKDGVEQEFRVNARKIMQEGDPDLDFPLQTGDRIIVQSRGISIF